MFNVSLTDVKGAWSLGPFELKHQEVTGLSVMAKPQSYTQNHTTSQLKIKKENSVRKQFF